MQPQQHQFRTVFFLGVNIEKSDGTYILSTEKNGRPLKSEWRMGAVKKLLDAGITQTVVVVAGPIEQLWPEERVDKAPILTSLLIKDYDVPEKQIEALPCETPNTRSNFEAIKTYLERTDISQDDCAVLTDFWHIPRTLMWSKEVGVSLFPIAAEGLFARNPEDEAAIKEFYSSPGMGVRIHSEARGMADYLNGTYISEDQRPRS